MRIDGGGRSMGYSADTGPKWSFEQLGPGLDLALCEATFLHDQEGQLQHLSGRQAGASARKAGAARLVLTHIWPTIDKERSRAEAVDAYGGPVQLATVNETYEI
jgi:ribonuclease BN (tRNA processing enzyme)